LYAETGKRPTVQLLSACRRDNGGLVTSYFKGDNGQAYVPLDTKKR